MQNLIEIVQGTLSNFSLKEKVVDFAQHAFAKNTLQSYKKDWKHFGLWLKQNNTDLSELETNHLILYITYLATQNYKASSIQRKIVAICQISKMNNRPLDTKTREFELVWNGIRRKLGTHKKGKDPLMLKTLQYIIEAISTGTTSTRALRDKALLTFGWASAMRRSEITALTWADLEFIEEGVLVTIKKSKTDKFSEGQKIAVLYGRNSQTCPIKNLLAWKNLSYQNQSDYVFCSITKSDRITQKKLADIDVSRIIKKWIKYIGLDDSVFSGHSLRSGLITTASKNSVPDHVIMKHSRHKTAQMIHVYTRDKSLIDNNVTGLVGL